MIATNGCAARFLAAKGVASLRRVVRSPERWLRIVSLAAEYGTTLPPEPDAKALELFLIKRRKADPLRFPDLSLVVAPGIKAFADLKGRVIAVDGARTGYALLLRKLLAENGLGDGACEIREFGGSQERFDALESGSASASLLNPPFDRNLFAQGFGSLGAINDFFPLYPGPIAATRRSWARRNEQQLIAFIRGFGAGYAWLQDPANKAEAIGLLPSRLNIGAEAAAKAYDRYATRPRPRLTNEGLQQVIDVYWDAEGLKPPRGAPEKYLDLSYQQRAEAAQ